jgi:hypothetical protein
MLRHWTGTVFNYVYALRQQSSLCPIHVDRELKDCDHSACRRLKTKSRTSDCRFPYQLDNYYSLVCVISLQVRDQRKVVVDQLIMRKLGSLYDSYYACH